MTWVWLGAWALTVVAAAAFRTKFYAAFVAVLLGGVCLVWSQLFAEYSPLNVVAWALSALVFVHFLSLIRAQMRSSAWRVIVTWPALWFVAGSILAIPWAIVASLGFEPYLWWAPYLLALVGVYQSTHHKPSIVTLKLGGESSSKLKRALANPDGLPDSPRPLRIAHLTDTHLGPFVSEQRLIDAIERLIAQDPDLILLTGDFMTMESSGDSDVLRRAFGPLKAVSHKTFACRGNHDLEAPKILQDAFDDLGIEILIDSEALVDTEAGPVQLVGIDFKFRGAKSHVIAISEQFPKREDHQRVVLLHNPGHFKYIPDGLGALVLSGHTHGGQVGTVDLGIEVSMFSLFVRIPDHGFWSKGQNRLYVSRGLGHYGFPLRIGVSAEESVLVVHS